MQLLEPLQEQLDALWYNPGPGGPGYQAGALSFAQRCNNGTKHNNNNDTEIQRLDGKLDTILQELETMKEKLDVLWHSSNDGS